MPLNNFGIVEKCPVAFIGRCAQPDATSLGYLRSLGFDAILKLNNDNESSNAPEMEAFKDGFIYDPYPQLIKGNEFPLANRVSGTVLKLQELYASNRKVVVHCTHGRDRTGLIIGAYRILADGWSFEKMQEERKSFGATGLIDNIADSKIIEFLKNLKP